MRIFALSPSNTKTPDGFKTDFPKHAPMCILDRPS